MEIFCGNNTFESTFREDGISGSGCSPRCLPLHYHAESVHEIPDHILVDVMNEYMDDPLKFQLRMSSVCRRWGEALSDRDLWRTQLQKRFGMSGKFIHPRYRRSIVSSCSAEASWCDVHPKEVYGATHSLERRFSAGIFVSRSRFHMKSVISCVTISPGGIFVGDVRGRISRHRHCPPSAEPIVDGIFASSSPVSALQAPSHIPALLSGHSNGTISIWASSDRASLQVHDVSSRVSSIVSNSSSIMSVSSIDSSLRLTDFQTGKVSTIRRFSSAAIPNAVALPSSLPNIALVGFRDNCARVIDTRTERDCLKFSLTDWCLCVEACDDHNLFRASDKSVKLFDVRSTSNPIEQRHLSDRLVSRFKSDSALRLVSCGLDGEVKISSLEVDKNPVSIHACQDYILCVDFDRTTLVCGGMSGKVEFFSFN